MNRSAPRAGYDFGRKRQYRRDVYALFKRHVRLLNTPVSVAKVLLMPSSEGDEIEVALAAGFRERNLFVVDRNRAIVAHLKRRWDGINTYGVDIADAAYRIAKEGHEVHAANIDLCGPVGDLMHRTVDLVFRSGVLAYRAAVCVTVLRGREQFDKVAGTSKDDIAHLAAAKAFQRGTSFVPDTAGGLDAVRLGMIGSCFTSFVRPCVRPPSLIRWSSYKSTAGSQTMLWGAFEVFPDYSSTAERL